jgi:hypothetical protein
MGQLKNLHFMVQVFLFSRFGRDKKEIPEGCPGFHPST